MAVHYKDKLIKHTACRKVIIIDSSPIVRHGLAHLINDQINLTVCGETNNIEDAIIAINEYQPDIVITDISCGKGNGISLIEIILNHFSGIPILVLSMYDESLFAERCLNAGARGYVEKTEPTEKIIFAIRKILKGGIYISDRVESRLLNKFVSKQPKVETSSIASFSNRELDVFLLMGQGLKVQQIADQLNISVKTIGTYVERVKRKMSLNNTREVFMHAVQWTTNGKKQIQYVGKTTT
jgi:DNA-binding NarL/FixJ family response regulator